MNVRLSQSDLDELLASPTVERRVGLATHVATLVQEGSLGQQERAFADTILKFMAEDAALRVRTALTEIVKSVPDIPHEVALKLANDFEPVSLPMLESSPVLTDADLIEIIRAGSDAKQSAIAGRETVSETVASVIVDEGGRGPVAKLMGNAGAQIAEKTLGRVVDRFGDDEHVIGPLVQREVLPVTVAERLVAHVSDQLREFLLARPDLPVSLANAVARVSRDQATISLFDVYGRGANVSRVVEQLYQSGRLTPSLVLRAACLGDQAFLEEAMAKLAGIAPEKAWLLIHDKGQLGLQAIFDACGLPPSIYPAVRVAVDIFHDLDLDGGERDRERFRRSMIERILTKYQNLQSDDLDYLLLKIGQIADNSNEPQEESRVSA